MAPKRGKLFAAAMALLTALVTAGVLNGPKLRKAMEEYPATFGADAEPAQPNAAPQDSAPLPVAVTVEQSGKVWSGSIPRIK